MEKRIFTLTDEALTQEQLNNISLTELVKEFNANTAIVIGNTPLQKFSDKKSAIRRTWASMKPATIPLTCEDCGKEIPIDTKSHTDNKFYCPSCLDFLDVAAPTPTYQVNSLTCAICGKEITKAQAFITSNGAMCKDSKDCHSTKNAGIKEKAKAITQQAKQLKSKVAKVKTDKSPTSRDLVRNFISDKESFTVAEIAELLNTNIKNASVTISLLITRPGTAAPIPFTPTGKGLYSSVSAPITA
jgi:hypothetical protein